MYFLQSILLIICKIISIREINIILIPSLNLEVEIKDDGSARNISQESRDKDKIKENTMKSLSNIVNFIKIVNKDYTEFEKIIKEA